MSRVTSIHLSPSLLSADFGHLTRAATEATEAGADFLHFDVMDGRFVPNISMGPRALQALRPVSTSFFDAHLMIVEPDHYLEAFAAAGADGITVQAEACVHLQRTLARIRGLGKRAGVAINPATPPSMLEYVMNDVDLVLVMTVNPGFSGQAFLPSMLPKIEAVRRMIEAAPQPIHLEVDGGISEATAPLVTRAGANVLVAGSALYDSPFGLHMAAEGLRRAAAQGL